MVISPLKIDNLNHVQEYGLVNFSTDRFLDEIGNILYIDILYEYIISTVSLVGVFMNIINIYIYFHKDFELPYYFYFKALSINGLVHCFFGIFYGLSSSPRYVPWQYVIYYYYYY